MSLLHRLEMYSHVVFNGVEISILKKKQNCQQCLWIPEGFFFFTFLERTQAILVKLNLK